MAYSYENAAQQVQERLKALNTLVHSIEGESVKGDATLENISKSLDKINQEGRLNPQNQQKLKALYTTALGESLKSEELLRQALTKINEIRTICNERRLQARYEGNRETFHHGTMLKMLQLSAQNLPLWLGSHDSKAPPLCGAVPAEPNYIAKPGDMVAALIYNSKESKDMWILAEVVSYNIINKKYEVDDIDEDAEPKLRHTLSRRQVVPLPLMRANPETDQDALFPVGAEVMALYPHSTCFYKAVVNQLPSSVLDDYELVFEDSSYTDGYAPPLKVAQRFVIDIKENKKS